MDGSEVKTKQNQHVPGPRKRESGNALWFILIAIVLLGALTAMLSQSSSTTDDTGTYEREEIDISKVLRYAAGMRKAVENLQARGCSENELSFATPALTGYSNPDTPPDNSCMIFESEGAGLTYQPPSEDLLDTAQSAEVGYGEWYFPMHLRVLPGTESELMIMLLYVKQNVCTRINRSLGIDVIPEDVGPVNGPDYSNQKFGGEFDVSNALGNDVALSNYDVIENKQAICFKATTDPVANTYVFYQTLIDRE